MSDLVSVWNELGAAWCGWMLERSVVSAVTLVIVGLVILVMRGRLSAHAPSHLLLLPLVVLVVPLERVLPTHWPEPLPSAMTTVRFAHGDAPVEAIPDEGLITTAPGVVDAVASPAAPRPSTCVACSSGSVASAGLTGRSGCARRRGCRRQWPAVCSARLSIFPRTSTPDCRWLSFSLFCSTSSSM